jgi:hypothetical protein
MPRRDLALHDHKMTLPVLAFEKYCPWVSKIAQATRPHLATIDGGYPAPRESELDPSRDEDRHQMLMTLLAEEMAKDNKPPDVRSRGLPCPLTTQGEQL